VVNDACIVDQNVKVTISKSHQTNASQVLKRQQPLYIMTHLYNVHAATIYNRSTIPIELVEIETSGVDCILSSESWLLFRTVIFPIG
jgi:hypothetical protein